MDLLGCLEQRRACGKVGQVEPDLLLLHSSHLRPRVFQTWNPSVTVLQVDDGVFDWQGGRSGCEFQLAGRKSLSWESSPPLYQQLAGGVEPSEHCFKSASILPQSRVRG